MNRTINVHNEQKNTFMLLNPPTIGSNVSASSFFIYLRKWMYKCINAIALDNQGSTTTLFNQTNSQKEFC